jgi:hypothetical protein
VTNCIQRAAGSAQSLLHLLLTTFGDLFDDRVEYKGRTVSFHKRAQIFIADLWACYEGQGLGRFEDIDTITMFADYRVPQGLLYHQVIQYSPALLSILKRHEAHHESKESDPALNAEYLLRRGDPFEVEIRGVSIHAVELLVSEIRRLFPTTTINAIILDFYLWDLAKETETEMNHVPIHRTRSIYY